MFPKRLLGGGFPTLKGLLPRFVTDRLSRPGSKMQGLVESARNAAATREKSPTSFLVFDTDLAVSVAKSLMDWETLPRESAAMFQKKPADLCAQFVTKQHDRRPEVAAQLGILLAVLIQKGRSTRFPPSQELISFQTLLEPAIDIYLSKMGKLDWHHAIQEAGAANAQRQLESTRDQLVAVWEPPDSFISGVRPASAEVSVKPVMPLH
jgi:hypothetical protein